MACAIGLSRILREDRATKDGYKTKVTDGFKMGWNGVIVSLRK